MVGHEISVGGTIAVDTPPQAGAMLWGVAERLLMPRLAVPHHNTDGQTLANVSASIEQGWRVLNRPIAGAGRRPFRGGRMRRDVATKGFPFVPRGCGVKNRRGSFGRNRGLPLYL